MVANLLSWVSRLNASPFVEKAAARILSQHHFRFYSFSCFFIDFSEVYEDLSSNLSLNQSIEGISLITMLSLLNISNGKLLLST